MNRLCVFMCMLALGAFLSCAARAQSATTNATTNAATDAIDISADGNMTWDRNNLSFSVEGNASATQGDMTLSAQKMTARYTAADDPGNIHELTATGGVVITAAPYRAEANRASYDPARGIATLTGGALRMTGPDATLTAQKEIIFDRKANTLTALGSAEIRRGDQVLKAEKITARFITGPDQKMALEQATAEGSVTLQSPNGAATAQNGAYDPKTGLARLTGGVVIRQGQNILEGAAAEMNMITGFSQITGTGATPRVKATFYPKKKTP
jgi:lipopolysaccharide export system protein LptA